MAGSDIAKSGIGHDELHTLTQDSFDPDKHVDLLKSPRLIVKFGDTGTFMFYICCKRHAI